MSLIYRLAAGVELTLVLSQVAAGNTLPYLGHSHTGQIAIIFGTAFLLDEFGAIAKAFFHDAKPKD